MKAYKGNIVYTKNRNKFEIVEDGYILVDNKKIIEVTDKKPNCEIVDWTGKIIIPAFNDIHVHAPQYPNKGLGYDEELLPWLNTYTFPTEAKYKDIEFADKIYKEFINNLWKNGIMRSVIFSTLHEEGTIKLFDLLKESNLSAYVGKVNMDRNSNDDLTETKEDSIEITKRIIDKYKDEEKIKPIITPRFVPSCTDDLMEELSELIKETKLPVQSHLSENRGEVAWVKELHPNSEDYASVYNKYNMFGQTPTVMAHCVYCTENEKKLLKENGVFVAHCPTSNLNLMSGIAPIKEYLDRGIKVGLGTDVSGGHTFNIMQVMVSAIQSSKMHWLYVNENKEPLTIEEAFYLATKGGGEFFGKVGSFEKDYLFDALVVEIEGESIKDKIEKLIYNGDDRNILVRYIDGEEVKKPFK